MTKDQRRWTPAEDALLREGFRLQSAAPTGKGNTINWNEIAKMISRRTNKDCRKRYYNKLAGSLKKGPWTEEEDSRLRSCVQQYGPSWAVIAQKMENRSADQCSKRWNHSLNPELERRPWTDDENQFLLLAVTTHGNSWKDIQTIHFPTRSANNVKNQYTILTRKAISPPDADTPPCCPQRSESLPPSDYFSSASLSSSPSPSATSVSSCFSSASSASSQASSPSPPSPCAVDESCGFLDLDNELFGPCSPSTSADNCSPADLFDLLKDADSSDLCLERSEGWSSPNGAGTSGSGEDDLDALFSPVDFVDMADFQVDSPAFGLENFDVASMSMDTADPRETTMDVVLDGPACVAGDAVERMPFPFLTGPADAKCKVETGGVGGGAISGGGTTSRITITIDDAHPDTVMRVMTVLMQSRAKVQLNINKSLD